jgi:hypothetical protein
MTPIISTTATQIGFGTDRYKHVVGLTAAERIAVRQGSIVIFQSDRRAGGRHGTYWRRVIAGNRLGRFYPRTVSRQVVEAAGQTY